jgi:hypothetical protein
VLDRVQLHGSVAPAPQRAEVDDQYTLAVQIRTVGVQTHALGVHDTSSSPVQVNPHELSDAKLITHSSPGMVDLPAIALPVCHVAAPYQTGASRQNESPLATARIARFPPASQT